MAGLLLVLIAFLGCVTEDTAKFFCDRAANSYGIQEGKVQAKLCLAPQSPDLKNAANIAGRDQPQFSSLVEFTCMQTTDPNVPWTIELPAEGITECPAGCFISSDGTEAKCLEEPAA